MLLPLLFVLPLLVSLWHRRAIPAGSRVEITFDLALPSKWAAELTQQTLIAEVTKMNQSMTAMRTFLESGRIKVEVTNLHEIRVVTK